MNQNSKSTHRDSKDADAAAATCSPCACCGKNVPKEGVSDYCMPCWNAVVTPAYRHVESLKPDMKTPFPAWHGWAVREAFIAGAASQIRLANTKDLRSGTDS
jgi:hypothetical protein